MTTYTDPWPAGSPCWLDLASPDIPASQRFYADVLGWTFSDPEPMFGGYVQALVGESPAAGIAPAMQGARPAWTLYLATDDIDATVGVATESGGAVDVGVMAVGDLGRMALLRDPSGAAFGVWESALMSGYRVANEPGALAWEDLRSSEPSAARDFYATVFGYGFAELEMAGPDYRLFCLAGTERPLGGMGGMTVPGGPSHWLVYFAVTDLAAAVAAVQNGGGTVTQEPFDTPFGAMAAVTDQHGAAFMLAQTERQD